MKILDICELVTIGKMLQDNNCSENPKKQQKAILNKCKLSFKSPKLIYLVDYIDCIVAENQTLLNDWTSLHEKCVQSGYEKKEHIQSIDGDCEKKLSYLFDKKSLIMPTGIKKEDFKISKITGLIGLIIIILPYIIYMFTGKLV